MVLFCAEPTNLYQMTEANYQIVQSPYHGDGIIATKPLQCNDVVFSETPLFFLQSLPNRQLALVCSHCSRFLGSTGLQMKYLQKEITRQDLSEAGMKKEGFKEYFPLSEVVPCVLNCGELYCSSLCQQQHWCEKGHCLLCTGQIQEDQMEENALYQLKVFAVQSNEIFLMISDIIAEYITKHDPSFTPATSSSSEPRPDSLAVFQHYVRNIWWEAISLPKVPTKRKQLQKTLQNLVNGLWEHLNSTFQLKDRGLAGVFSKEWIARTIGMFEQNNVGVRVENPILTFIKQVDIHQQPEIVEEIFQEVIKIRDSIEDEGECYHDDDDDEDDEDEMEEGEGENEDEDMAVEDVEGNDTLNSEENSLLEPYQRRWAELQRIITEVGEDSLFPPLDGTAFFILTCKINHSCDPNVRVNYHIHPTKGLELKMLTIKDIGAGEELLQSYIDQFQDKKERQKALKDYGFTCQCSKCLSEA